MISLAPANLVDMADLYGGSSRLEWSVAREMWAVGQAWAARAGEDLVAIAGLYPLGGGTAEAWHNFGLGADRHMLAIVRAIRLTLRASGYREIVTIAASDAGVRIARAVGFSFHSNSDLGEVWVWTYSEAGKAATCKSSSSRRSSGAV